MEAYRDGSVKGESCLGFDTQGQGQEGKREEGCFLDETWGNPASEDLLALNTWSQWDLSPPGCRNQEWEVQCEGSPTVEKTNPYHPTNEPKIGSSIAFLYHQVGLLSHGFT